MRGSNFQPIEVPVGLFLEYDALTVRELSNLLSRYQTVLRSGWRAVVEPAAAAGVLGNYPSPRILTTSMSSTHSMELIAEYAIPAVAIGNATLGPMVHWPNAVRTAVVYLLGVGSALRRVNLIDRKNGEFTPGPAEVAVAEPADQIADAVELALHGTINRYTSFRLADTSLAPPYRHAPQWISSSNENNSLMGIPKALASRRMFLNEGLRLPRSMPLR